MASILRGRLSTTEETISSFILNVSFLINHNPLLLLGLCFRVLYAAIQYLVLFTTQTGSIVSGWRRNTSYSSEVHDGDAGNPYVFRSGKSDLKNTHPLIEIDDRDSAFESELVKTVENTTHIPPLKNHPFDLQDTSSLGIRDIVILLAEFGSKDQNIAAAEKRKDIGLFQGYAVPSFWSAGASRISPNKGAELGDKDVNFQVPLTGKTMKVPKEHTCVDSLCYQPGTCKLLTTSSETEAPSEAETTQEKSSDSGQKGSQALPDTGKPAAQVSKSPTGSNSYCHSSSGSGGDDGDDGPRRNGPPGGCQGDNHCSVDESEEHEQQREEQSHQGGDCSHNQDSMSTPTEVPSDTGNSKDKTSSSNQKVDQTPTNEGKPAGQVSKTQQGNTSYRRSSSGSGGDDGGEDRKRNLRTGGCQGDGQCEVDDLGETETSEQDDHQVQEQSPPQKTENILDSASSCDGAKRSAAQGLRIDVLGARMIAEASLESQEKSIDSQSEAAGGLSLSDQFNCHHPEADLHEAEQRLQQAFTCRRHLNSENEWKECGKDSCREIQEYLSHSQNCVMRVLGGCKKCICYKEVLVYHVSRCHLPMGACVVQKCDAIREYFKENRIPDRKWPYQLDKLFFSPSPPATPTSSPEKGDHIDQHFMAQLLQEAFSSRSEVHDISDADNLNHQSQISEGSLTSSIEKSLRESSGVWNQYHVDRPPDLLPPPGQQSDLHSTRERSPDVQVTRGPTVNAQVRLEQHISDRQVEPTAPLSAACMPVIRQDITQEDREEVIWPLDQRILSVGEDGSYVEGVHWRRVKYIGGGSCGRCHFCADAKTGCLFAIKKIPVRLFQQMEIDTWGSISGQHPNILDLYGAVKHKETVVIFMEYMEGGSVEEYRKLDEGRSVHILGKVVSAVDFMHSRRLLHRDIKGGNVLLDATGQKVKLADFGTTSRCDGYLQDNSPRGTEAFMAPEVCRSEQHSFSSDIWGLMCLLYQMLVGKPPWMEFSFGSLLFKIGTASQPPQSPPCSPEVEDFFSQGFVLEPSERATAAELLRHQVFVTAPCVSNIPLPPREEIWLGEDGSLSSEISDSDTESLVSEQSSDVLTTDCEAGNYNDDQEEEMEDDSDNDSEASDGYHESSMDMLEPDHLGVEAAMFIEEPWQGPDLSVEEQLQSLQSELFLSLEGQDLERALNEIEETADVNDNDINRLKGEDFDVGQYIGSLLGDANMSSTQPPTGAFATLEGSYSIIDLTKLHIMDSEGNLVFTIRERPSTRYGNLGEEHHGNIASVLNLDAFTLTREDGTPLNVRAEIGFEEQAVRVVRAHDTDNWQPYRWRVDVYGRVEQFFEF